MPRSSRRAGCHAGREPHHRNDREPPRLGDLAPARLGCADHALHQRKADGSVDILSDPDVNVRVIEAFEQEGADAWYKPGARERFLGKLANEGWQKVDDILDVWFEFGLDARIRA